MRNPSVLWSNYGYRGRALTQWKGNLSFVFSLYSAYVCTSLASTTGKNVRWEYVFAWDSSSICLWHRYSYQQDWLGYLVQSKISSFVSPYLKNAYRVFCSHCLGPSISGGQSPLVGLVHSIHLAHWPFAPPSTTALSWDLPWYEKTNFSVCCLTLSQNCCL